MAPDGKDNADWAAEINGGRDDDEALRVAMALSLGQEPGPQRSVPGGTGGGVIDLTKDDGEEEHGGGDGRGGSGGGGGGGPRLRDEKSGSREVGAGAVDPRGGEEPTSERRQPASTSSSTSTSGMAGLAGLDRRKMEEERLARLSKRKASGLDAAADVLGSRPAQRPRIAAQAEKNSSSPSLLFMSAGSGRNEEPAAQQHTATAEAPSSSSAASAAGRLPFPRGVVKKTWAFGQPRQGDDIKIEEVLQKQQLELAVLSSYQWDVRWLLSKVDLARTKLILIAFAADEAHKEEMRNAVPRERIRFCFPPMQPVGSMHSKLQLLKYEKYMRIVVPTGNLMSFDWGETGTMENMVFIIDLPKFQTAEQREAQKLTPFGEELLYFLRAQGLDEELVSSLLNYDFAETSRYHFVHTIPGSHAAEDTWQRIGYCGLGRAVKTLDLSSSNPIELDYVCASLGAVTDSLLAALYYACQGDSGLQEYSKRTASGKTYAASSTVKGAGTVREHVRVFFPSRETVLQSKGGKNGAGTICFQARWWQAASFPREVLRDCVSVRKGLLMHSKVIYVRPRNEAAKDAAVGSCFAYVGSANLSESAWGRLVRDRATGKPKLTCRNWECGVLVKCGDAGSLQTDNMAVFEAHVPVPMEWPSRPFPNDPGPQALMTPWFYSET
ncbi:5c7a7958-a57c-4b24-83ed-ea1e08282303 [Thermothielavioides terrestris]|uniref:5c7a7958-a57c-4b24-83ed-ea1e08282303 n=1 Tax=Thermothielavioides terrestris TaxID=2587410 RepID=A0A446BIQ3_9PEZI|nr:5c7a7958-a57c-4b24-83ed-ea1e08282303 [Thermothielavioides terrestris]